MLLVGKNSLNVLCKEKNIFLKNQNYRKTVNADISDKWYKCNIRLFQIMIDGFSERHFNMIYIMKSSLKLMWAEDYKYHNEW